MSRIVWDLQRGQGGDARYRRSCGRGRPPFPERSRTCAASKWGRWASDRPPAKTLRRLSPYCTACSVRCHPKIGEDSGRQSIFHAEQSQQEMFVGDDLMTQRPGRRFSLGQSLASPRSDAVPVTDTSAKTSRWRSYSTTPASGWSPPASINPVWGHDRDGRIRDLNLCQLIRRVPLRRSPLVVCSRRSAASGKPNPPP